MPCYRSKTRNPFTPWADDSKIQLRAVKTGNRVGELWIIEQGLKPGDRVVVEGLLNVQPGVVVTTRAWGGK